MGDGFSAGWKPSSFINLRTGYPFTIHTLSFRLPSRWMPHCLWSMRRVSHTLDSITDPGGEFAVTSQSRPPLARSRAFGFPFGGGTGNP